MGANAQTSVPTFTAGQVLTAANMNISARTGIPVFADTTARDAAFGGTGEKTLAEGQYAYIENIAGSAATQYYDGAAWQTLVVGGLTLISATTIGTTVSSVTVSNAFSSTYDNYKITISGGVSSASAPNLSLQLGATTTGYYYGLAGTNYGGTANTIGGSNQSAFNFYGAGSTNTLHMNCDIMQPNLAKNTIATAYVGVLTTGGAGNFLAGFLNDSTQYTAFTVTPSTGTITGGTIRVYGYANS
jgi:hypothetical protein